MMKNSRHKRGKIGQMPGDIPLRHKIHILESDKPYPQKYFVQGCSDNWTDKERKMYRKAHREKCEKRFRRGMGKDIQQNLQVG